MSNQDENDRVADDIAGTTKSLLLGIGGVVLVLSILVLLPMFFTYLSEGDTRAPFLGKSRSATV